MSLKPLGLHYRFQDNQGYIEKSILSQPANQKYQKTNTTTKKHRIYGNHTIRTGEKKRHTDEQNGAKIQTQIYEVSFFFVLF